MSGNLRDEERNFLEDVGVVFEKTGLPRMAGRLFGWLLISAPPYQSPAELADVLMASKGSISTTARLLEQMGLIERYIIPGERHNHFKLSQNAMRKTIEHGLEDEIKMFRLLAEKGMKLMKDEPYVRKEWLEQMRDRYQFLDKAFPKLMERYDKRREKLQLKQLLKKK